MNYLAPSVSPSLFRNGRVRIRRDPDGGDDQVQGITPSRTPIALRDARATGCTLEEHGFAYSQHPLFDPHLDFLDHRTVVSNYYADCCALVGRTTRAREVFAFDHNVRSAGGKKSGDRIAGGQDVQGPARMVHGDYTLTSAPQRLRDLSAPPRQNDTYRSLLGDRASLLDTETVERTLATGRFALINVWRNIDERPVARDALALCAARSVERDDLVVLEIHYPDRVGENYFAKPSPRHEWYTYPGLERDEALLIKQWDSVGPLARSRGATSDAAEPDVPCTFSFHTAYHAPEIAPDAPDRWSIEVRCIAFYDGEPAASAKNASNS